MASQSVNGGQTVNYQYDNNGLLIQADDLIVERNPTNGFITRTTLGHVTDSRTINRFGEMENYSASYEGAAIFSASYVRDTLGHG